MTVLQMDLDNHSECEQFVILKTFYSLILIITNKFSVHLHLITKGCALLEELYSITSFIFYALHYLMMLLLS